MVVQRANLPRVPRPRVLRRRHKHPQLTLPRCQWLHSSTFQLILSALYWIGDARRGFVARVKGVCRVCRVFSCDRQGSS